MPVLYEVNLVVEKDIETKFAQWLEQHIQEMLALPCFHDARWWVLESEREEIEWCVHYFAKSRTDLQEYFDRFALQMRGDGLKRFGNKFAATRRILFSSPLDRCQNYQ